MIIQRPIPTFTDMQRLRDRYAKEALAILAISWLGGILAGALVTALIAGLT